MTTAIYYRVSTEDQTIEMQSSAIEDWIAKEKYVDTYRVYSDIGISGKSSRRPEFQRMLKDIEKGRAKTVLVYKLDRLTRDSRTAIQTVLRFDELGVKFISITQPMFSHGTPMRQTMITIFAELAQMERETIVERVKAGMAAARKRGVKFGAPIKVSQDVVIKIVAMREAGQMYRQIAEELGLSVGAVHKAYVNTTKP